MKIISNFKDFYDYLQGIYGIDPKVVYERVCQTRTAQADTWAKTGLYKPDYLISESDKRYVVEFAPLAICGKIYCVYMYNGKFYFGNNKEQLKKLESVVAQPHRQSFHDALYYRKYHLKETDINEKENCPVCLCSYSRYGTELWASVKNVRLSDFGIGQIISPNDMYIAISNFLSREKPIKDTRSDVQKLEGKGFDKKTSFRHPVK